MIVNILKLTISPMAYAGLQMLFGAHKFISSGSEFTWLRDLLSSLQHKLSLPPFDDKALLVKAVTVDRHLGYIFPNFIFFHTLGALKVSITLSSLSNNLIRSPLFDRIPSCLISS